MFRGFIRKTAATASQMKISLASLLDVFQSVQIPTQTITPNNRTLPYIPVAVSPYADTGSDYISPGVRESDPVADHDFAGDPRRILARLLLVIQPAGVCRLLDLQVWVSDESNISDSGQHGRPRHDPDLFLRALCVSADSERVQFISATDYRGGPIAGFLYLPPPEFSA